MAENSAIEWTHHTFNPWRGCTKVSDGCKFCYADTLSKRNPQTLGVWGVRGKRVIAAESYWKQPVKWNKEAQQAGERRRVFCASLADVFEGLETMPIESWELLRSVRVRLFELIANTPHLDWLLLTKRPENISQHIEWFAPFAKLPENVWLGTSVENQEQADKRIPELLKVPATVRFLSCEPLLGSLDLSSYFGLCQDCDAYMSAHRDEGGIYHNESKINWVIVGGESGSNARPMHPDWVRGLRDECVSAGVAFFFKQWGEWWPGEHGRLYLGEMRDFTDGQIMVKTGKKGAGRLLDNSEWSEYPTVAISA